MRILLSLLFAGLLLDTAALAQKTETVNTRYERGTLTGGRPTGTWEYLNETGELELRMNYDSSRIAFRRPDTARYELRVGEEWKLGRPSRAPGLIGSRAGRRASLQKRLRYPVDAIRQQTQGNVLVSYVVGADGRPSQYIIEKGLSAACDQEVGRVLLAAPTENWIAPIYRGQPTAAKFYLKVTFSMLPVDSWIEGGAALNQRKSDAATGSVPPFVEEIFVTALGVRQRATNQERGGFPSPARPR